MKGSDIFRMFGVWMGKTIMFWLLSSEDVKRRYKKNFEKILNEEFHKK